MPGENGLLQRLSAMPHSAIAHEGSAFSVALKPSIACANSKEWSNATARLNSGCAAALQDVEKLTAPSFSLWTRRARAVARMPGWPGASQQPGRAELSKKQASESPQAFFHAGGRLAT